MAAPEQAGMAEGGAPSREQMFTFLKAGIKMMEKPETREMLKDKAKFPDTGKTLIELQRVEWDTLHIGRDLGCKALDEIDMNDKELVQARQEFVNSAMRTFLQSLTDRKPKKLEHKKAMTKAAILQFFDACNTKMDLPEMRVLLYNHYKENKTMPNQVVIDMQREMLETLGWEKEHGCRQLSKIGETFPKDQDLHQRMMHWQQKAQEVTMHCMKYAGADLKQMSLMSMLEHSMKEDDEMKELTKRAEEEVEAMTGDEQEALVDKMQKKMETLMKLPEETREAYMKKIVDGDKMDIIKSKVIMLQVFKQKVVEQKAKEQADGVSAGAGAAAEEAKPLPVMAPPSTSAPSQMSMMACQVSVSSKSEG